jgi:beta-lactamase regulating signal transducer with metallopeptidase domain
MIFAYQMRLVCLCLEAIFLVNLTASTALLVLHRTTGRAAAAMRPQQAAKLFFTLRLFPSALSLFVVILLCIPSYLRYEPNFVNERLGWFCLITSVLGLALCLTSVYKLIRLLTQRYFLDRQCRRMESISPAHLCSSTLGETSAFVLEEDVFGWPLLALVGILRPRLIISRRLLNTLSDKQLEAALCHERAHQLSRDNLKRAFTLVAPGVLPFVGGLSFLERQWERFAELAADDHATNGRIDHSLALAEALIQVARMGNVEHRIPLATSLSASSLELATRVNRLLAVDAPELQHRSGSKLFWNPSLVFVLAVASILLLPEVLGPLHRFLESLLH